MEGISINAIVDNWTLQNVGELISNGFSNDQASVVRVRDDTHSYDDVSECIVQTEALFDIMTEIVLRETLVVDGQFTYTWESADSPINPLDREGIIRKKPFTDFEDHYEPLRSYLADRMCVTDSLKLAHAENVRNWAESNQTTDPYLSAVLWGGAGMVARSSAFGFPYSPHPLRRRLFLETGLFLDGTSPQTKVEKFVEESRLRLLKAGTTDNELYALRVLLPPIPAQIINESDGPSNLVDTAIQLRAEYAPLRQWLSEVEDVAKMGDPVRAQKLDKVLREVTRKVDKTIGNGTTDATLSVSLGAIRLSKGLDIGNPLRRATKVYSTLNRMVFSESGNSALKKLCRHFDAKGTAVERKLTEHFSRLPQT